MIYQSSVLSYSKAPWGSFRLVAGNWHLHQYYNFRRVGLLRQRQIVTPFVRGQNLPDKEFRYLRTVIVTAAVYWGFNSKLRLR